MDIDKMAFSVPLLSADDRISTDFLDESPRYGRATCSG